MHKFDIEYNYRTVEKLLPFKSLYLLVNASFRSLSRLLCRAATGNCPDLLGWVTARLTTAITCDTDRSNFDVDRGQVESLVSKAMNPSTSTLQDPQDL